MQVAADAAVNMYDIDIQSMWLGTTSSRSASGFTVDVGGNYLEHYAGTGLSYDGSGRPVGGIITGLTETLSGQQTYTVIGASLSVSQINGWARNDDTDAAMQALFPGHDTMTGGASKDILFSNASGDYLYGGGGGDYIVGGYNSHIYGNLPTSTPGDQDGADQINCGRGMDYVQGNAGNDTISGWFGNDRLYGGADDDEITGGDGDDWLQGNKGNDNLSGQRGDDVIHGGAGDDMLSGDRLTDYIASEDLPPNHSNDQLFGDLGNDTLDGGWGADTLTGGDGADVFAFSGYDFGPDIADRVHVVTDFVPGEDHITIGWLPHHLVMGPSEASLDDAYQWAATHYAGPEFVAVGNDTYMFFSTFSGSQGPDMVARFVGHSPDDFTTDDFV